MISSNKANLNHPLSQLCNHSSASIANTFLGIDIAKNHNWGTNFELELGQRKSRAIDGVKILHRIHQLSLLCISIIVGNCINAVKGELLSRKLIENLMINIINICVAAGENCTIGEVLIR